MNEVGLAAIGLGDGPEVVVTQAEVQSQFRIYFPVVLEVSGKVVLRVVGLVDVRGLYLIGTSRIIDAIRNGRQLRLQQELRYSGAAAVLVWDIRVSAVVVELAARIRRLQCRKLYVLIFNSHLEVVLAVNLREVVGDLKRLADFVGRQEVVAAQS